MTMICVPENNESWEVAGYKDIHFENERTGERFSWDAALVRCVTFAYGATHVETTDGKVQTFANPANWLVTGDQGLFRCSL